MILIRFCSYLAGGYDKEEKAARAYDLAALKYWGTTTTTNFPVSFYFLSFKFQGSTETDFVLGALNCTSLSLSLSLLVI
jgi:hypothetical protein